MAFAVGRRRSGRRWPGPSSPRRCSIWRRRAFSWTERLRRPRDPPEIRAHSRALGHVPIIETSPRGAAAKQALDAEKKSCRHAGFTPAAALRYRQRTASERVNGRLKDSFGGRTVTVRGHAKVFCHLMFAILAITVDQVMRLVT